MPLWTSTNQISRGQSSMSTLTQEALWKAGEEAWQAREWHAVLKYMIQIKENEEQYAKAWYLQALAHEALGQWEAARCAITTCLHAHPKNISQVLTVKRRIVNNTKRDAEQAAKQPLAKGALVHSQQRLRLHFRQPLPDCIPVAEWIPIQICIVNEFNLFAAEHFPSSTPLPLNVTLHALPSKDTTDRSSKRMDILVKDAFLQKNGKATGFFQINLNSPCTLDSIRLVLQVGVANHNDIVPVASLPYQYSSIGLQSAPLPHSSTLGLYCLRPISFHHDKAPIWVAESPGQSGIGGKVWDSSFVLMTYLHEHTDVITGKRVLELGSGVGPLGLVCATLAPLSLTMTDMGDIIPLLRHNIALNGASSRCTAIAFPWQSKLPIGISSPDVVLLSDVVYDPEGYLPLQEALLACSTVETCILMAHRSRHPQENEFFENMKKDFQLDIIHQHEDIQIFNIMRLV